MNTIERQIEEKYLDGTLQLLKKVVETEEKECVTVEEQFNIENEKYLNSLKDMDLNTLSDETAITVANLQTALEYKLDLLNRLKLEKDVYKKMLSNPYFAKITILPEDTNVDEKYYIGTHTLNDEDNNFVVLDWRSPIASVYYDYQVGKAKIVSDNSVLEVDLLGKRQFKIENGKLEYFFDTNLAIEDELLQDALGHNSSNSMKSIVQTIQAQQNKVIRWSDGVDMIVNGVAGSGKTAIALHRIAYLLYKQKDKLTSDSVLVLSHNNAFSSYISQVLPELAERDVNKVILDVLCAKALSKIAPIENKYESMDRIINNPSQVDNWKAKTSVHFYNAIRDYCYKVVARAFEPKSFMIMGNIIPQEKLEKLYYEMYAEQNIFTRFIWMSEALVSDYFYNVKSVGAIKKLKIEIFEKLVSFLKSKKPVAVYLDFLKSMGLDMRLRGNKIKNEDAYAIWYIKMFIGGYNANSNIKHLVVDEVQEYSALQLKIIDMLYPATKTMLGDVGQCVEYVGAKEVFDNIDTILGKPVEKVELNKSYRSTMQITKFFAYLAGNERLEYVKRSGEEVRKINVDGSMELATIAKLIKENKNYNTIAIITKTNRQAKELYAKIKNKIKGVSLIANNKDTLGGKINIISAFNSKGLEFDYVIVYDASEANYSNDYDMNLLFIACSRAVNRLDLLSCNDFCSKIKEYKLD